MAKTETAVLAGGCFWCTEAIFKRLKGVKSVVPGYSGGVIENPSYEEVLGGKTGHAEAIKIEFNPEEISYEKILDIFWHTHDPTTINRQGNDIGPQYRSVVFYKNENQKRIALNLKAELENKKEFENPIITETVPYSNFYEAEDYHKNYYENHKDDLYCDLTIAPKIQKLFDKYKNLIKNEYGVEQIK
jgi:peptide-methionine (S)-S-oxide reductase